MIRIVSDTSTMYSTTQAEAAGFYVSPLSVTIAGRSYREFDEISAEEFVDIIRQGHMPTSSQPAIGEVEALYQRFAGDEIINIAMASGLSGTYNSAVAAAQMCDNAADITVINTRTLCGPHRYMVEQAVKMVEAGLGKDAKLTPVMTQTETGERLTPAAIRRGYNHAVKYIVEQLQKAGIGEGWQVQISHAGVPEKAEMTRDILQKAMPGAEYKIYPLSLAFITQGGPGCFAVQYVKM